jgi:hypothetical protein
MKLLGNRIYDRRMHPVVNRNLCLTWKQVSLLVNFSISPGKQDRRRFAL